MDMLEIFHILADDEQVVLPFVDNLELLDGFAATGMEDPEE